MAKRTKKKDPSAVALGRKGGLACTAALTADELSKRNTLAAKARWKKAKGKK